MLACTSFTLREPADTSRRMMMMRRSDGKEDAADLNSDAGLQTGWGLRA